MTNHHRNTFTDNEGYLVFCDNGKPVHVWVMEQHLGRPLEPNEVIHHLDGNHLNNDIHNLITCASPAEHLKIHESVLQNIGNWVYERQLCPAYD